jgi:nucleoside-diphosphate-sugar epimerase
VVEAAIAAGCESVVVLSTIYVFGHPTAYVDETWPYGPVGGVYGTSKAAMERWCLKRAESSPSTRIVVLNPSCVYGPGGTTYSEMPVLMARERTFCLIDAGRGAANYTYVDNLIDAMLLAATSRQAHGQRFIVNDGCTTWRTFFEHLIGEEADRLPSYTRPQLQALHHNRQRPGLLDVVRIALNNQQLRSALRQTLLGEVTLSTLDRVAPRALDRMRRRRPAAFVRPPASTIGSPVPPVWLAELFGPARTTFASDRARRVLGWTPRVPLDAGMTATRTWVDDA